MRILALVPDAFGGHGGIAQYNRDFLTALCQHSQVSQVVAIPRVAPKPLEPLPEKLLFDTSGLGGSIRYVAAVARRVLVAPRFDLVYCGHIHLMPLAWLMAWLLKIPLWLMIYGIEAWQPTSRWLADRLSLRVSRVISISGITQKRFLAWCRVPQERCSLLPNAIDLSAYGVGDKSRFLLERYGLTGKTVLLTFGRLVSAERAKGFDEVLELLPELIHEIADIAYVIAGDGDDRERLREKAQALGLAERVVFTGLVVEQEKADLYRLADAYVMPSRGEGFGFVLLEAMACGAPVVASCIDGGREAVRDGKLGILVHPNDPKDIRRGILEALGRPREIPSGLEYFSFANFTERVHALVDTITDREARVR